MDHNENGYTFFLIYYSLGRKVLFEHKVEQGPCPQGGWLSEKKLHNVLCVNQQDGKSPI
jgi:hypothetical protein